MIQEQRISVIRLAGRLAQFSGCLLFASVSAQTPLFITNGWTGLQMLQLAMATNPPQLSISPSNESIVVSWPLSCSNCVLQAATNLTASNAWAMLNSPTSIENEAWGVTLPITGESQFFRLAGLSEYAIPLAQFAVFYDGLLEFSSGATMVLHDRIHANGPIYTGSSSPMTFYGTVSSASTVSSPTNAGAGPDWPYPGDFQGNPPILTNTPVLRLPTLTNDAHAMIEMPPPDEDPNSALARARYFNRANVLVLVSNTSTTIRLQQSSSDPSPIVLTNTLASTPTNVPFLTLTNRFIDLRERFKTNIVTQIDIGIYANWLATNPLVQAKFPGSPAFPYILFIADQRTTTTQQMASVRIINGINLPVNGGAGFTLVTPNPLYIRGHYNCTNSAYLGTSNTSASVPAALIADAVTILSPTWNDSLSGGSYTLRNAASTTVNAAFITGNVPSTGPGINQFSGGLSNFVRLLEDWSNDVLTLNTSFVCLYTSRVATNQFIWPGAYYKPPTRKFGHDAKFLNLSSMPPGCPVVYLAAPAY